MSAGHPPRCTTEIALVRGVISGAIVSAVIAPDSEFTSKHWLRTKQDHTRRSYEGAWCSDKFITRSQADCKIAAVASEPLQQQLNMKNLNNRKILFEIRGYELSSY